MFTSKELFMTNAGDKRYILKDGFADVYSASSKEEEWKEELIKAKIDLLKTGRYPFLLISARYVVFSS